MHPELEHALARAERFETMVDGRRIVWRRWGDGPSLLLLHGGHGAWNHWVRNVIPLSHAHAVWAPDMPGYGESDDLREGGDAQTMAEALSAGLAQLPHASARLDVVGFSFGALVGGHLCAMRRGGVDRFVMVGSAGLGFPRFKGVGLLPWRRVADDAERRALHRQNLGMLMLHAPSAIDDLAVALQDDNSLRTRFRSRDLSRTDALRRMLPELDARLAGIWGAEDATAAPDVAQRGVLLRSIQPDAWFRVIEDAGHWVQYERADAFNQALLQCLDDTRASADARASTDARASAGQRAAGR